MESREAERKQQRLVQALHDRLTAREIKERFGIDHKATRKLRKELGLPPEKAR